MSDILPRVAVIASIILLIAAIWLWKSDRKRALLMLIASVVIFINALLWGTMPDIPEP